MPFVFMELNRFSLHSWQIITGNKNNQIYGQKQNNFPNPLWEYLALIRSVLGFIIMLPFDLPTVVFNPLTI